MTDRLEQEADSVDHADRLNEAHRGSLSEWLGIRFLEATRERVRAELVLQPHHHTGGERVHGGTLMALADSLGAAATWLNLPPDAGTTTLESKTNFLRPGQGDRLYAEAIPLHRGRRTMVWQTDITDAEGRLVARVTQTQMVLPGEGEISGPGNPLF